MAYADWNHYAAASSNHILNRNDMASGVSSLDNEDPTTDAAEVLAASEADAPTEARVETQGKVYAIGGLAFFFRWQDVDNYYAVSWYNDGIDQGRLGLGKMVAGAWTETDTTTVLSNYPSISTLSNGTEASSQWAPYRVDFWETGGVVYAELYEDADGDGKWTQLGGTVEDTMPELGSGGGVGVGCAGGFQNDSHQGVRYDETEVFY